MVNITLNSLRQAALVVDITNSEKNVEELESLVYFVSGMWCGTCAKAVESGVASLPGIAKVDLNFLTKLMTVVLAENACLERVSPSIISAVSSSGYTAIRQEQDWLTHYRSLLAKDRQESFSTTQLFITLFLSMWTSMFALARYSGGLDDAPTQSYFLACLTAVFGTTAVLVGIPPYARAAFRALKSGALTFDLIISIGAFSAICLSILALLRGEPEVYVDSAAMIITVLLLTKWFESFLAGTLVDRLTYQLSSTNKSLEVFKNGVWRFADESQVKEADLVRYQQGQIVTLDGTVNSPQATVTEELLTGEASTRNLVRGEVVNAGMCLVSPLELRVSKTLGSRLIDHWAKSSLLRIDKTCDDFRLLAFLEKHLVSLSLCGALLLGILAFYRSGEVMFAAQQFFVGILIFCPCLLVSVLPMAQLLSSNSLRKHGVLLTSNTALSRLATIRRFFFDKTGTLFLVQTEWECFDERSELMEKVLAIAKSVSTHPILSGLNVALNPDNHVQEFKEYPGEGLSVLSKLGKIVIGRPNFLVQMGVAVPTDLTQSASLVGFNGKILGGLYPKSEHLVKTVTILKQLASERPEATFHVLSGDPDSSQEAEVRRLFGERFSYQGNLRPQEKADIVKQFDGSVFIGDGLNDTPALNSADVSIRVGRLGKRMSETDLYIAGNDFGRLKITLDYAKRFRTVIRQTVLLSFTYNLTAFLLAGNSLFNPLTAVLAMLTSLVLMALSISRLSIINQPQYSSDKHQPFQKLQPELRSAS